MKKELFISIGLIFLLGCDVDNNKKFVKSDLVLDNIKGKVYSLKEFSYKVNENYGVLSKGKRARQYSFENDFYNIYNRDGRKIEEGKYDDESNGGLVYKLVYTFDHNGNLIEGNYFNTNDVFLRKQMYSYDKFGNLIMMLSFDYDGSFFEKLTYEYDQLGNTIEENIYNNYDQVMKTTYQNDSVGNTIEEKSYDVKGNLRYLSKYKYNAKGYLIKENVEHLNHKSYNKKTTYKYDINGNKIEENSDGSIGEKLTFTYEYDNHLNWTRRIEYKEEEPKYIIEREILYFE